jgi:quercetin dioxygenase-like cupin family protein
VEIFQFDRTERDIDYHASHGLKATRVAAGAGPVSVTCLNLAPGGLIGTHPATGTQFFLVISGAGWVAGNEGALLELFAPEEKI